VLTETGSTLTRDGFELSASRRGGISSRQQRPVRMSAETGSSITSSAVANCVSGIVRPSARSAPTLSAETGSSIRQSMTPT
jgi:hypothetical protein